MRPGPCRRAIASVIALVVCAGIIGIAPGPAAGDEIADKRAEAKRVATRVEQLNTQIEVLAEDFNTAQIRLDELTAEMAGATAAVDAAKAQVAGHEQELRQYAVAAYVKGGHPEDTELLTDDGSEFGQRKGYLSATSANRQQLVDQLNATEDDLQAKIAELESARGDAETTANRIAARKSEVEGAQAEQRRLLNQANSELNQLVAAEQQRRAATRAQAAAKRAAKAATTPAAKAGAARAASAEAPPQASGAEAAVARARAQLGDPYRWGGSGPDSFDCSGLTMYSWQAGGVSLPHSSKAQYSATTHIPLAEARPGDLIFYGSPIHHVAIYIGGGQIIHAPHEGDVVKVDSVHYWDDVVGAGRVRG